MGKARKALKRVLEVVIPDRYIVWRMSGSGQALHLTFDDGPNPEFTPRVLDILDELDVRATFFLVGERAVAHPRLVSEIVHRGHSVGNHSYTHRVLPELAAAEYAGEIERTKKVLSDMCGREIRMFRPPKGLVNAGSLRYLIGGGHQVVLWSVDSLDYRRNSDDTVVRTVETARRGGDIVLMHDDNPFTVNALRSIITRTRERGMGLEAL